MPALLPHRADEATLFLSSPAKAGDPVITALSVFTGSPPSRGRHQNLWRDRLLL